MPTSLYQITVSNFNGTTPCQSYSVYTGTTHDIDDADYVEDVNVPVSGYTLDLDIDSSYTGVYLFIEHCDGHINSVPSSTPKLQGGYQLVFVDLRCDNCIGERPAGTPTPTITPTRTPTLTPTYSQTITPTYSQTITPTYSQTITPTINASATPTPTYSQTVTPTYSQTVTPTRTPTLTPTNTLTPMIEEGCYCYEFYIDEREFGDYGGPIVEYLDCGNNPQSVGFSGIGTFSGYCISSITNWYRFIGPELTDIAEIVFSTYTNTMNPCTVDGDCIVTGEPTPTPTPTLTRTPTLTPTYSQTVTPTRTPTLTPTLTVTPTHTQTVTPTLTPTNSQTITPTQTITLTATPIIEQTPTPTPISETPCNCYTVECTSGDGCPITFVNCIGEIVTLSIAGSYTTSICGNIVNLEQPNLIITNTGKACFFDGEIYSCLECQCATINIDSRDLGASDDGIVYVDMIKCDGTEIVIQYNSPATYVACVQVIDSMHILVGGAITPVAFSNFTLTGGTCTVDNDCMD